jgi:hypothetical protein
VEIDQLKDFLKPYPAQEMEAYRVPLSVNNPRVMMTGITSNRSAIPPHNCCFIRLVSF